MVHLDANNVSFAASYQISFEIDVEATFVAGDYGVSRRVAIAETTLTRALSTPASVIVSATFVRDKFGRFHFQLRDVDVDTGSLHLDFGYLDLHDYFDLDDFLT